jgi:hypothetical protein
MDRRLILKYCPEDVSDSGVPLVSVCYEGSDSAPYLRCTRLTPIKDVETTLSGNQIEYVDALLRDIDVASNGSREAALLMLSRLEAIAFGPIRCFPEA